MKVIRVFLVFYFLLSLVSCQRNIDGTEMMDMTTGGTVSTELPISDSVPCETALPQQSKPEYLWSNGARYILDTDDGYALYDAYTYDCIGIYHDFRILSRFDRQGEMEEVCYLVGEDNGKNGLLEISANTLIFRKEIKESIDFYGDYMVIDGKLYSSDVGVLANVEGSPREQAPTLTDPITFEESSVRIVYVEGDTDQWLQDPRIADQINGCSVSTVFDGTAYVCLNRDSNGFYACSYRADTDGGTSRGFYVCERKKAVDLWYADELYSVYWSAGVSWIITPTGEVVRGINGTIEPGGDFLVYFPSDQQLPKTFLTRTWEVCLDHVVSWSETDNGLLVWYFDEYRYDTGFSDSGSREEEDSAYSMLGFIDNDGNFVEYGRYEQIFDVNHLGALAVWENTLVVISSNGQVAHSFDGWNTNMRYVETVSSNDGNTAEIVFSEYNEADRTSRTVTFYCDIPTAADGTAA